MNSPAPTQVGCKISPPFLSTQPVCFPIKFPEYPSPSLTLALIDSGAAGNLLDSALPLHYAFLWFPYSHPLTLPSREDTSIPSPMRRPRPLRSRYRRASSGVLSAPLRHQPPQAYFFVKKKDGGLRPCIDYRSNKATVKISYHLLLIPTIIEQMHGAQSFTKLDLKCLQSGAHS